MRPHQDVIFALQAALLVPYIIIGVMGGGTALAITGGLIPYPAERCSRWW